MFVKATRKQAKLRLALAGPSGSGKTTSALMIATGLGGKIAVCDTERGSASLYSSEYDFDVVELGPPYTPEKYIEIIYAAEKEGYDTLILDSITHEWNGMGGVLDIVNQIAATRFKGNSYAAWGAGTPRHQKFLDAMLNSKLNIIATMRSKTSYVEVEAGGKKRYQKQGMEAQQRDGIDYEFTVVFDLSVEDHIALTSKDRTRLFPDPFKIGVETGELLKEWLEKGEPPVQQPPRAPQQPAQQPQAQQASQPAPTPQPQPAPAPQAQPQPQAQEPAPQSQPQPQQEQPAKPDMRALLVEDFRERFPSLSGISLANKMKTTLSYHFKRPIEKAADLSMEEIRGYLSVYGRQLVEV